MIQTWWIFIPVAVGEHINKNGELTKHETPQLCLLDFVAIHHGIYTMVTVLRYIYHKPKSSRNSKPVPNRLASAY